MPLGHSRFESPSWMSGSQSVVPRPAASGLAGGLLEMQSLRSRPRPVESEKPTPTLQVILMQLRGENQQETVNFPGAWTCPSHGCPCLPGCLELSAPHRAGTGAPPSSQEN